MCKKLLILTSFVLMLVLLTNAQGQATGTILREVWEGIGGTYVSDLTGNANYPDNPTFADEITSFEAPTGFADNFGSRVHGWLHPVTTGDYTFWIATDDGGELWLSTDEDPANAVLISTVSVWAGSRQWDDPDVTPSGLIPLVGGRKYYISALYKEGGGGDNLSVAWEGPDSPTRDVIAGSFLSPAPMALSLLKAKDPVPADGAVDVEITELAWTPGPTAVSHKVYLSTDETIEEADLLVETDLEQAEVTLDPGVTRYWRVDEIEADGTVREGYVWTFTTLPVEAHFPSPGDGAVNALGSEVSWTPGKGGILHNVYFGTDPAALVLVAPMNIATSYDAGVLEPDTTYYWKIEEFPTFTVSPVWSFTTPPLFQVTDPNLVAWWKCDEGVGTTVLDWSGTGNHGSFVGDLQWVDGIDGAALALNGDGQYVDFGNPESLQLTEEVTITAWVKMADPDNAGKYMGIAGKLGNNTGVNRGFVLVRHSNSLFRFWYVTEEEGFQGANSDVTYTDTEWHHVAGVISGDTGVLYVDGVKQAVEATAPGLQDSGGIANIGRQYDDSSDDRLWNGLVDDVRIYNIALGAEEIRLMGADLALPYNPDPANGAGDLSRDTVLTWNAGDGAQMQDVYLGTDADAVAAAHIYDTTGIYRGSQAETTYAPDDLADGATHYWRVDQVSVDGSTTCITTGPVWSFDVAAIVPLYAEDFESFAVGTDLHDVNGWEGWEGAAGAGAPVSDAFASSGSNSVEIIGTADLVAILDITGGQITLTAMQYIPSGTTGNTFFILMDQYAPNPLKWASQTKFSLDTGQVQDGLATIVYDQWVELKYVIDLDNNTYDESYNGVVIRSAEEWSGDGNNTLQAIDLYSAGASSVYYDDIVIK